MAWCKMHDTPVHYFSIALDGNQTWSAEKLWIMVHLKETILMWLLNGSFFLTCQHAANWHFPGYHQHKQQQHIWVIQTFTYFLTNGHSFKLNLTEPYYDCLAHTKIWWTMQTFHKRLLIVRKYRGVHPKTHNTDSKVAKSNSSCCFSVI